MITPIMNSTKNMIFIIEAGIIKQAQAAMNNEITITIALLMMWRSEREE